MHCIYLFICLIWVCICMHISSTQCMCEGQKRTCGTWVSTSAMCVLRSWGLVGLPLADDWSPRLTAYILSSLNNPMEQIHSIAGDTPGAHRGLGFGFRFYSKPNGRAAMEETYNGYISAYDMYIICIWICVKAREATLEADNQRLSCIRVQERPWFLENPSDP